MFDVIIVGGGPAGMMAAGRAAQLGARVLLLEKNQSLGVKLLLTGGGRSNITHAEFDDRALLAHYGESGKFLFSTFAQHSVKDTLDFFHTRGMQTKVEAGKRAFPMSDSAHSVLDVLVAYMREGKVTVRYGAQVRHVIREKEWVAGVLLVSGEEIHARAVILAAGGSSRPDTGYTGDAFAMLQDIGHTIVTPNAALVPVAVRDEWIAHVQGISLSDAKVAVLLDGKKELQGRGKLLFTHFGVSGPLVLKMSREIGERIPYGEVILSIDLVPQYDAGTLNDMVHRLMRGDAINKVIKNTLTALIPAALVDVVLHEVGVDPHTPCHSVTRAQRLAMVAVMKGLKLHVSHLLGLDKAIISSGGIALEEVDPKTMQSRLFSHLYVVGDVLNIDRPSGGFSLQLCWTTGYVAGSAAALSTYTT